MEDLINKIHKELDLTLDEVDDLIHDLNNLRGDEWLDIVEEGCSKNTIKKFKKFIDYDEDEEE